jgi:2-dehydro-3-deoxyphosphogluconate aldolase/(4S)-4-hydroxy-2-oxoglutarate aldolase
MLTGAGTVIDITQAKEAAKAGADFLVSPGLDERIARWSSGQSLPYFPGVATATEIQRALGLGIKTLKWFPASLLGGPPMLRAINGPFGFYGTAFIPTGGITRDNMVDYLREPNVIAVGGSFIMPEKLVIENSFEKAVNHTKSLLSLAKHG